MLKNALPMQSFIRQCWLVTHRIPEAEVRALMPPELTPVTHGGFAFLNTVVARMEAMRPKGIPAICGLDYWHVGYRLYARATTADGDREGLYFLRSDCDRRALAMAGNLLSEFRFNVARIEVRSLGSASTIRVETPGARVELNLGGEIETRLSAGSPFATMVEAEAFLKYKPCGLAKAGRGRVNAIPIYRNEAAWQAWPVQVLRQRWEFLNRFQNAQPELVFEVAPIEYHFGRGRILEVQ